MNKNILNTGVQEFIINNLNTDIVAVLFKKPYFRDVSNSELAEQLEARKKCEKKLPTWFNTPIIYYPNKLNIEQTSSEITARYKAEIVCGKSLLDVTGGLGVDSYFFSQKIDQVTHCEIDQNLSRIAAHNFDILSAKNINTLGMDGIDFLKNSDFNFDWVYIDPSRRDQGKKIFFLADCVPNVLKHQNLLFSKTSKILIKTSPLLDISIGMNQLHALKEVHVVAVKNEVKELLWVLEQGNESEVLIKTVNITRKGSQIFDFHRIEEENSVSEYSEPLRYLYEPNAAILKSGAFKSAGNRLEVQKLNRHTHLFTSNELVDFPGRRFKILKTYAYNQNTIRQLTIKKANIATRNFPKTVAEIRKKLSIAEGGVRYLFFIRDLNENLMILECTKVA